MKQFLAAVVLCTMLVGCTSNTAELEKLRKENEALKAANPVATATAGSSASVPATVTPTTTTFPTAAPPPPATVPNSASPPPLVSQLKMMTQAEACSVAQFEYTKYAAAKIGGKWTVGDCTNTRGDNATVGTPPVWSFSARVTYTTIDTVDYMQVTDFGNGRYTTTFGRVNQ